MIGQKQITKENIQKRQDILQKILCFLFAIISTLSLNMRNTLYESFCPENKIANIFSRFYNAFSNVEYLDFIALIALFFFFGWSLKKHKKISISGIFVSLLLAVMYVLAVFYNNFNSTEYLFCDTFQTLMTLFEITGIGILLYFLLNAADYFLNEKFVAKKFQKEDVKWYLWFKENFGIVSFWFILICWLVWLLLTYPGSTSPDSIVQLQNFYGEIARTAWQPPFSSLIIGGLFHIGKSLVDGGFGMFLYNFFQGIVGALIFSFSLNRLVKRGLPLAIPTVGMLFFGLTPIWGAYVQWFQKDFLYTVFIVLLVTLISEVIFDRTCSWKMFSFICITGVITSLLRNNGIFVIVPTLIAAGFYLKGIDRKKIISSLIIIFVCFELVTNVLYPAIGIGKSSTSETLGVMFQATARYVQEYPGEVTEYEKEVISNNFYSYESLYNYDPRIMDPVKIYYNHSDFKSYLKIWFEMFLKHPMVYVESYLNGSYGYMAPVSRDIGAYINLADYDPYLLEKGVNHVEGSNLNYIAVWLWNINLGTSLIKYTTCPGLYTWLTIAALWLIVKNKKKGGIVLLIPNLVNIFVCTIAPLADAMRYALPAVAVVPFMIGWLFLFFAKSNANENVTPIKKAG
ncbi:MAG: hypothetical protein E7284_03945 [Lachnospiraceae bacterium]|nr:hypothetical protein [Lachnospiraceae bacterium]